MKLIGISIAWLILSFLLITSDEEKLQGLITAYANVTQREQSLPEQAQEFFLTIFETSKWPPLWQSGEWSAFHGWLYILSDLTIGVSYCMIPLILSYFIYKKKNENIPFKSIILLFIVFILCCGLTHLIDAAIFWWPAYQLSALVRFITATFSLAAVLALIKIAPGIVELKSPAILEKMVEDRTHTLQLLNAQYQKEIEQRSNAEQKLKQLYGELEAKSKGLEEAYQKLYEREQNILESDVRIQQLNLNLEKKVEQRTAQLNASNQELEAFTYSVSHDLRAPLRAIDGYAKILEEDYNSRIDAHGKHLLAVITRNARYMGSLIDDLLEFSKTSRSELIKSRFNTEDEVKRIASNLMGLEKNRNVEIDIKVLEACCGDIAMLRQVWTNLISNALKYTRKTEAAKIEIGSFRLENEIQYYIQDNGIGFSMEYTDKLFGVFQRLHKKEEFEGTGVGLALVKSILDRHDGKIWVEAAINKGATFHFSLPIS
jgi:signal transduction histidine kinase